MRLVAQFTTFATPLLINGYALVANVGLTSILGFAFWMIATRLYSQEQVGLAAAVISLMTTISVLTQLNLTTFLYRYLPKVHPSSNPQAMIMKAYTIVAIVTAIVALIFAFGVGSVAEPMELLRDHKSVMALFVVSTVAWSVFALQDATLSGLRLSVLVPIKNIAYAVVKIVLMVLFTFTALPPLGGVYLAWVLPLFPVLFLVNFAVSKRVPEKIQAASGDSEFELRNLVRFLGWDYIGTIAMTSAIGLATLMVTAAAGAASTASYHLAWTLAYSVFLVANSMSVSLIAEGAANPERLKSLIADTLCHTLLLVLAAVVAMALAAPQIMGLFGQAYATEGGAVLRILALSCIPWSVTTIYIAAKRAQGRTRSVAIVQTVTFLIFSGVSAVLLDPLVSVGVAYGWLAAHSVTCIGIVIFNVLTRSQQEIENWGLTLATSMGRMISTAKELRARAPTMIDAGGNHHAQQALKQQGRIGATVLQEVVRDPSLDAYRHLPPFYRAVISNPPASDPRQSVAGNRISQDGNICTAALREGVSSLAELHALTAATETLDDAWSREWIEEPISRILQSSLSGRTSSTIDAFENLAGDLRRVLIGRHMPLGLGHGNLWPGNLHFARPADNPSQLELISVTGWNRVRSDAPKAIDACHLTVTFRRLVTGDELGKIYHSLLIGGGWMPGEAATLEELGLDGQIGDDAEQDLRWAFFVLTWLQQVAGNLSSSKLFAKNRLWNKANVKYVLDTALATAPSNCQ